VDGSNNPKQVVAFGGGFDNCLNEDVADYPSACSSAKGKGVYILDAVTGTVLADPDDLPTAAPVITELAPIDINFDGNLDFFYVADVAGDLYRINLAEMTAVNPADLSSGFNFAPLSKENWTIVKIGTVADSERRFYNGPVVGAVQGVVIVTLGSGDRERPLESNYPFVDEVQNRFYALFDEPYKAFVENPVGELEADEATTVNLDGDTMLAVVDDDDAEAFSQEYDGWYIDLPDRGEQVANPSAIGGGKVFFNTFQPGGDTDALCERPLGIGKAYALSLFGPEFTEGEEIEAPGFPIPPSIFTVLLPRGYQDCEGNNCPTPPENQCATEADGCRVADICIGCKDLSDIEELLLDPPPLRRRVFFTEDIDRTQ
jgi:type IV pilus assembly protein PilY1